MSRKALLGAALALALGAGAAAAEDVTVRMLHVNQTNQPLWQQIAENYNKTHPGVKVTVEYLENEAYKAKLPTLLQSEDKPDIIYSWGGGVMRAQDEAGLPHGPLGRPRRPREEHLPRRARRLFDRRQAGRHPLRLQPGRALLQQGADGEGRRRPEVDGDLGRLPRRR